jgi:Zn-dependent protease with chaperone function
MMAVALLGALILLPYALDLRGATPARAAAIWFIALVARAAVILLALVWIAVALPRTDPFIAATQWCWHAIVPFVAAHLDIQGHGVGDIALLVPLAAAALSAAATAYGVLRAAHAVRSYLRRFSLGRGPRASVIVPGREIVLAATGISRPQVLVSAGALLELDDGELAMGLEHEWAHIARRHRWVLFAGALARAVGRPIPGSTAALRELSFHLERDADRCALDRLDDRLALASVICKAAMTTVPSTAAASIGGADAAARVRELMDDRGVKGRPAAAGRIIAMCLAAAMVAVALPAQGAVALPAAPDEIRHCPS